MRPTTAHLSATLISFSLRTSDLSRDRRSGKARAIGRAGSGYPRLAFGLLALVVPVLWSRQQEPLLGLLAVAVVAKGTMQAAASIRGARRRLLRSSE